MWSPGPSARLLAWAIQANHWPGLFRAEKTEEVWHPTPTNSYPHPSPGNILVKVVSRGSFGKLVENRSKLNVLLWEKQREKHSWSVTSDAPSVPPLGLGCFPGHRPIQ